MTPTIKNSAYYANSRIDLIQLITKKKDFTILEIGAGYGETLAFVKENYPDVTAIGIDINYEVERRELYERLDDFKFGNIEEMDLNNYADFFDVIILADVLEHLKTPNDLLDKIRKTLKPDGEIISSIPNIRNIKAFYHIFLRGNFPQEKEGIFDSTHLRFYCKKDMCLLFKNADYKVDFIISALRKYKGKSFKKSFNRVTFGIFEEFLSTQYFLRVLK